MFYSWGILSNQREARSQDGYSLAFRTTVCFLLRSRQNEEFGTNTVLPYAIFIVYTTYPEGRLFQKLPRHMNFSIIASIHYFYLG